jgi:hypothetical protein
MPMQRLHNRTICMYKLTQPIQHEKGAPASPSFSMYYNIVI